MVAGNEEDEDAAMEEQLRIFLGDDMMKHPGPESSSSSQTSIHPGIALFLGGAFCLNLGMLLSLPPVLRGRGAPYLPTFGGKLKIMFQQVRSHPTFGEKVNRGTPMRFVDLGSGDGRVVFRAAREKLFQTSIGYEINPVLHMFASTRRLIQAPLYWSSTDFALKDLWKVDLTQVDVVAVYGLSPIMDQLGVKLKAELPAGTLIVSNVFPFPGWRTSVPVEDGVHLYVTPHCWGDPPPK